MKSYFDLGIRVGHLITMAGGEADPVKDQFIGVKDGTIEFIGPFAQSLKKRSRKYLDSRADVVLPGFVNGHTHLPMTLFRGVEDDVPFHVWLFERILPLETALVTEEFVRVGASLAALECIRFGVTTVNEMYFYAEASAKVLDKAGMRGLVSQAFADFPLPEDKVLGTDKEKIFRSLYSKFKKHKRIVPALGPHAPYSCSDALLKQVAAISEELAAPVHIHVSETEREVEESRKLHGKSPVGRLQSLGFLSSRTICAHCVHLDEADSKIFKDSGASAVYNPDSNMKLSSGATPVKRYLASGIPVALGTDGAASNNDLSMFGVMDIGTKLQKLANKDSTAMTAKQALSLATYGGAHALGLGDKIGSLEVGKRADFISVSFDYPHMQPIHDVVSQLVYAAQGLEVRHVVCDGKVLLENGRYRTLNQAQIMNDVERIRRKIQKTLAELRSK